MSDERPRIRWSSVLGGLVVVAAVVLCVRLGFWQLDRKAQRQAINDSIAARLEGAPTLLSEVLRDTAGFGYRPIELTGRFDDAHSIVLPGRAHRGVPGVHLLTPLLIDGAGLAVLVNRGWIGTADAVTVDPLAYREPGEVAIHGIVMPFPGVGASLAARARIDASDTTFRRIWFTIDELAIRRQFAYPLADFMVRALPSDDAPTEPLRLSAPPLDPGPHLGYAIQWFSFAVIAIIGTIALARSRAQAR